MLRAARAVPTGQLSWRERILALRNRVLANHRFQQWAAGFPLTRPIARRRAQALFDLCAGFVYSQVLLACVQLRLLEQLTGGPLKSAELAPRLGLKAEAAERLLAAAASLDLICDLGGERYGLGQLGASLLGNPGAMAMVEHHAILYLDLADPVALLQGESQSSALSAYWSYARCDSPTSLADQQVAPYTKLMAASQAMIADEILNSYSLRGHQCLLDVAGGDGSFLIAAAKRAPQLQLRLFELPAVAARAERNFARSGLAHRARVVAGNLYRDPLPGDADMVSLVRVIHDHDDDAALHILKSVRQALPSEGVLLLAEPMSGTPGAEAMGDAYFGFYLLAMGQGRPRSKETLEALLRQAGFGHVRALPNRLPMLARVLVARAKAGST